MATGEAIARPFPRRLVAALALSSMLTPLNSTMISVLLPRIGVELDRDVNRLTQALVTSYLITSVVAQAPGGKLGDRFGHRRMLAVGQACFAIGSVAALLAPSLAVLIAARIAMAAAGAVIVPCAGALLRLELPPNERGRAFGAFGASMALSAAIGPALGGEIARVGGWRAVFFVNLAVLPIAALLARLEPVRAEARREHAKPMRFDALGSLLLGVALSTLVVGANLADSRRIVGLLASTLAFALFVAWERKAPEPVVDLSLFRAPVFVAGGLIIALHNLPMYALLFELPQLIRAIVGPQAHGVGPLLGSMMIAMVVVSPFSGRLADELGARLLAVLGCTIALLGAGVMFVTEIRTELSLVPSLVLFGIGLGLTSSPAQAAAMTAVPRESSGIASAVMATMRYFGGIVGILVLGALVRGSSDPAIALAEHRRALAVFSLSLAGALACAVLLPRSAPSAVER